MIISRATAASGLVVVFMAVPFRPVPRVSTEEEARCVPAGRPRAAAKNHA
jgi:hypothetical protein